MRFDLSIDDLNQTKVPGTSFHYSSVKVSALGASEYTLVTIALDTSGSISMYQGDLLKMLNSIVDACKKSPKADNLLLRVLTFNDGVNELHGFIPLTSINTYDASDLQCHGMTALFDATLNSIAATRLYGEDLVAQDYEVNAVIYIATDGEDNRSTFTPSKIKQEIAELVKGEKIESITTVLVDMSSSSLQDTFQKDAGLTQLIKLGDITVGKLAKLGQFVSRSISSTSQSLGTGSAAPIQSLTF
jgi:uncharacterized protein YegL